MKLLYPFAKRYIAGDDFESAQATANRLITNNYEISFNYVGEYCTTIEEARQAKNQYSEILNYYQDEKIDISIKLSQFGLLLNPEVCEDLVLQVAEQAYKNGQTIRFDMEHSMITDRTLDLCLRMNKKFPETIGTALQARLFRTKDDMLELMKNNVSVRLVKGAYLEKQTIALKNYQDIQDNYLKLIKLLGSQTRRRCAVATHDEIILENILSRADADRFDFEFIFGIRRDLQQKLKDQGQKVRIYLPYGENWLPYALRRLREWKNLVFILKSLIKERF
jgi:proline dehydrogenase